uniref:Uncharacterized protein n=1 Tax=viral metagenome TaxID=1070528 RepID=A0A6H1Z7P3_9ZZZZ
MAERMIVLKNIGRVPFQAVLYHDVVCAARQKCTCLTVFPQGAVKPAPVRMEASFRLNVKQESVPLPAAVLNIPQVKNGLSRRPPFLSMKEVQAKVEEV